MKARRILEIERSLNARWYEGPTLTEGDYPVIESEARWLMHESGYPGCVFKCVPGSFEFRLALEVMTERVAKVKAALKAKGR